MSAPYTWIVILNVINAMWIGLFLVWIAASISVKATKRREPLGGSLPYIILVFAGYWLVFHSRLHEVPLLNIRFVPAGVAFQCVGLIVTIAGIAFTLWARFALGRNWSAAVTIKENHELKRDGPYAFVRHPIYSGFLLAILGTAIAIGEVRGLIGLVVSTVGWRMKSLVEERFMMEQFGEQYAKYRRQVKALIPFVY